MPTFFGLATMRSNSAGVRSSGFLVLVVALAQPGAGCSKSPTRATESVFLTLSEVLNHHQVASELCVGRDQKALFIRRNA